MTERKIYTIERTINPTTIISGEFPLTKFFAEVYLLKGIGDNNIPLIDKCLDYYKVPSDMTTKQRLAYYYLIKE